MQREDGLRKRPSGSVAHNSGDRLLKLSLFSKVSMVRLVRLPISSGRVLKLLALISRLTRLVRLPISGGRLFRLPPKK